MSQRDLYLRVTDALKTMELINGQTVTAAEVCQVVERRKQEVFGERDINLEQASWILLGMITKDGGYDGNTTFVTLNSKGDGTFEVSW